MAWTTILNSMIDSGSILPQSVMFALRDNLEAVCQGLTGAPKVQTAGIQDDAITAPKLADSAIGLEHFPAPVASNNYNIRSYQYRYVDVSTPASDDKTYRCIKAGVYRVRVRGASTHAVEIYLNGALQTTLSSYDGSTAQTYDITLAVNDELQLQIHTSSSVGTTYTDVCMQLPFTFYLLDEWRTD